MSVVWRQIKTMMHFFKGENWQDGVHAGLFNFTDLRAYHGIVPTGSLDAEGLPERWVRILRGESGWIPKIVFKIKNKS